MAKYRLKRFSSLREKNYFEAVQLFDNGTSQALEIINPTKTPKIGGGMSRAGKIGLGVAGAGAALLAGKALFGGKKDKK